MSRIALATEDELSEQVGLRLAKDAGFEVWQTFRRGGSGYLKSRVPNFCEFAQHEPILLIADLDRSKCPSALIRNWIGKHDRPSNLLFRVAVREIESWIMADHPAMRSLLNCPSSKLPKHPDDLSDPKRTLLQLARYAHRAIRDELVATRGSLASQGLGYNSTLCQLIRVSWSPERAALRSPSLERARARLAQLASTVRRTGAGTRSAE